MILAVRRETSTKLRSVRARLSLTQRITIAHASTRAPSVQHHRTAEMVTFFDLSAELRNYIYELAFTGPTRLRAGAPLDETPTVHMVIRRNFERSASTMAHAGGRRVRWNSIKPQDDSLNRSAITKVCREIRLETRLMYYASHKFAIWRGESGKKDSHPSDIAEGWLHEIGVEAVAAMRGFVMQVAHGSKQYLEMVIVDGLADAYIVRTVGNKKAGETEEVVDYFWPVLNAHQVARGADERSFFCEQEVQDYVDSYYYVPADDEGWIEEMAPQ